jgi:hypothetical protein
LNFGLTELLKFEAPAAEQRQLPCSCGHQAHYEELRSKPVLTIVGSIRVSRPYYLCAQCGVGQFPVDAELDIENTEFSPGVRRMHALVGQQAPFEHGRQQMKVLAGLEVTTKSVERTAETIGTDIAQRKQASNECCCSLPVRNPSVKPHSEALGYGSPIAPRVPRNPLIAINYSIQARPARRSRAVCSRLPPRRIQSRSASGLSFPNSREERENLLPKGGRSSGIS